MAMLTRIIRILFGLIFFVFGLNGFLDFLPKTPPPQGVAGEYIATLIKTGYFWPLLKACETVCGLAILIDFFVPLALVVIAPVVVHIFLFHIFLSPPLGLGLFLLVSNLYLGWAYRHSFSGVLKPRTSV